MSQRQFFNLRTKTKISFIIIILLFLGYSDLLLAANSLSSQASVDLEAIYSKACLFLQSGLYLRAKKEFKKILSLNPQHQGALDGLLEVQKNFFKTEEDVSLSPDTKDTFISEHKKESQAEQQRNFLKTNYQLAKGFFKQGSYLEARNYLANVAKLDFTYRNTQKFMQKIILHLEVENEERKMAEHTLGPGDVVELYVKNNEELSGEITIQPAGELIIPSTNEIVMVNDLPKSQVAALIKERLKKYLKDPQLELVTKKYNSKKWYVLGEIGGGGLGKEYAMGKPKITLLEALYKAGLPLDRRADMRRVKLIRPDKYKPIRKNIDVYALLYYGDLSQNVFVHPGDIIYVPKTVLTKITETLNEAAAPISAISGALDSLESVNTVPPVTRLGAGPGQLVE